MDNSLDPYSYTYLDMLKPTTGVALAIYRYGLTYNLIQAACVSNMPDRVVSLLYGMYGVTIPLGAAESLTQLMCEYHAGHPSINLDDYPDREAYFDDVFLLMNTIDDEICDLILPLIKQEVK